MKITAVTTYLVGNPWKNWLFVRVDTDEGVHGVGEGSINAFARTVATAVEELRDQFLGLDPSQVELLSQRMVRDVYTDGGQIHQAAVAAIEMGCWDIVGKAAGRPLHELLGGRVRDRVPVYANGWYRNERTPEAFAQSARAAVGAGWSALKFDPFGTAYQSLRRREQDRAIGIVEAVREAVGPDVELMIEGHSRFSVATAVQVAQRLAPFHPAWFEEPVPHHPISAVVAVGQRSPVPIATGESYSAPAQFAELLRTDAVSILQPEPLHLGGVWNTRMVCGMAAAHHAVVAPHNAQGPVCAALSTQLGACVPNFLIQESFDAFNAEWSRQIVDHPLEQREGWIEVGDRPGLGIELDWERLADHPYQAKGLLRLYASGWELREGREEPG